MRRESRTRVVDAQTEYPVQKYNTEAHGSIVITGNVYFPPTKGTRQQEKSANGACFNLKLRV
ncbi:MAG: hypothetical protein GY820_22160 [Gammaproteobacteria bacterium]|nr:hypothetical protein [Gammaproteobacteria bacterium]